jgi:hypothetical protein
LYLELLRGLETRFGGKKPLYLVFGDFNLSLETEMRDDLGEWKLWPKPSARSTGRQLRNKAVDYILIKESIGLERPYEHVSVREFSPLPIKREKIEDGDIHYHFSNKAGLLVDGVLPFTAANDLKIVPNKFTGRSLAGIHFPSLHKLIWCRGIRSKETLSKWSQIQAFFRPRFSLLHDSYSSGTFPWPFIN